MGKNKPLAFADKFKLTVMFDSQFLNTETSLISEVEDMKSSNNIYYGFFLQFEEKVEDVKNISCEG